MSLSEQIKKARPAISMSSIRTYVSVISNLAKKMDIKIENADDINKHCDAIISYLKREYPEARRRKTILASLVVLLDKSHSSTCEKLRAMMMRDIEVSEKEDKERIGEGKMTQKEKDNWLDLNELKEKYNALQKEIKPLWDIKNLSKPQFQRLQLYVLLTLLYGGGIAPRRSTDYSEMKYKNFNKTQDNFYDKKTKELVYNKYKTSKKYGEVRVKLPANVVKILNNWIAYLPETTEYIFSDTRGGKLTPTKLVNVLHNFFGKKISTSMIRHIYISSILKDIPPEIFNINKDMSHSLEQSILYKRTKADEASENETEEKEVVVSKPKKSKK
jgi:integrase